MLQSFIEHLPSMICAYCTSNITHTLNEVQARILCPNLYNNAHSRPYGGRANKHEENEIGLPQRGVHP